MALPEDVIEDLEVRARLAVAGGTEADAAIVEDLVELVEHDPETEDAVAADRAAAVDLIELLVARVAAAHAEAERSYPAVTDCDRVDSAFGALDAAGIVAGQDVGSTRSDLQGDMHEHAAASRADGRAVRGWVGFHRQDLERVVETGVLMVGFAPLGTDDDAAYEAIGAEVAAALAAQGLTVSWSGSADQRIQVDDVAWQRRRAR